MRVIVLDPNQRIAATFDSGALPAAAEAMDAAAAVVRADGSADQVVDADGARPGAAARASPNFAPR